jgi:hypothetical protein
MVEFPQEPPQGPYFYSLPLLGPEKMETGKNCERGTTKAKYRGIEHRRQLTPSCSVKINVRIDAREKNGAEEGNLYLIHKINNLLDIKAILCHNCAIVKLKEITMTVELKRIGAGGTWHARADFTELEWIPTPYFGPASFEKVSGSLSKLNPGYQVLEVA